MNGVWASLFWKEWREHRWKLAALAAYAVVMLITLWCTDSAKDSASLAVGCFVTVVPLGALFLSASLAAGENAAGTIDFYRALPATRWSLALVKLVVCVSVLVVIALIAAPFSTESMRLAFWFTLSIASLVVWLAACGVNRSSEVRAAAIGIAVVVGVWTVAVVAEIRVQDYLFAADRDGYVLEQREVINRYRELFDWWRYVLLVGLPGGVIVSFNNQPDNAAVAACVVYVAVHGRLLWRWLATFGAGPPRPRRDPRAGASIDTVAGLRAPFDTPTAAILWRQARETLPVALAALALAIGWTVITLGTNGQRPGPIGALAWGASVFGSVTVVFAFMAALVAGVGLFLEDLRPRINTFWRSRPIPPDGWFWWKYASGLGCLLLIFGTAKVACLIVWRLSEPGFPFGPPTPYVVGGIGLIATYAAAVCACCLIRQPVYAAILAVGVASVPPGIVAWLADKLDCSDTAIAAAYGVTLFGIAVTTTLFAWQAVRRDWAILR